METNISAKELISEKIDQIDIILQSSGASNLIELCPTFGYSKFQGYLKQKQLVRVIYLKDLHS